MKIELIPALEIPAAAIAWEQMEPRPTGSFLQNPLEWENYRAAELKAAKITDYQRVIPGSHFISVVNWSVMDLRTLIAAHLRPEEEQMPVTESCALFGGAILFTDNVPVLIPQCCSTIADFYSWKELLSSSFSSGYFCLGGHPAPKATKKAGDLVITCADKDERFSQPAQSVMVVPLDKLTVAIAKAEQDLLRLCATIDLLSTEFSIANLSNYLVLTN